MVPPPPARERSRSTARPPAPAAGSDGNRGEQASPRQRARTPHKSSPVMAGEHEPEWYGDHAHNDQNDASDTRFVACQGEAEGRNKAERPTALQAPQAAQTGGKAHGPSPPPPQPPPRHTNATDRPHGGRTAPSQVGGRPPTTPATRSPHRACRPGGQFWAPHPHARAHNTWVADLNSPPSGRAVGGGGAPDLRRPSQQWKATPPETPFRYPHNPKPSRGEPGRDRPPPSTPDGARAGARTTLKGPTSAQCRDRARCARHTTQGGGERTPRERERTHTQRARGDYRKGNQTELAERTDRVEWRTSERG